MADSLTLTRPDDWHLHLRDGAAMAAVLPATARQFARAIVMPNLKPPVTTTAMAELTCSVGSWPLVFSTTEPAQWDSVLPAG